MTSYRKAATYMCICEGLYSCTPALHKAGDQQHQTVAAVPLLAVGCVPPLSFACYGSVCMRHLFNESTCMHAESIQDNSKCFQPARV